MQNPNKRFTQIILMFSMVAFLQCCCCIIPIRWRVRNIPAVTSAPAITQNDQAYARADRPDALSVQEIVSHDSVITVCSIAPRYANNWGWEWDQKALLGPSRRAR